MARRNKKKKKRKVVTQNRSLVTRIRNSNNFYWLILVILIGVLLTGTYYTFIEAGGHRQKHVHEFIRRHPDGEPVSPMFVLRGTNTTAYFSGDVQLDLIRFDESRDSFEVKLEFRNFDAEVRQMLERGHPTIMMTGYTDSVGPDSINKQFIDLTFVPGQPVDYGDTSRAVAQFFWKPKEAYPFYYPFDYYTFDLNLEILGFLKEKPKQDDELLEEDVAPILRELYQRLELEPSEEGYRCWVLPHKVSVQLPPNLVFRNTYEPLGADERTLPTFSAGRKSAIRYVSISVVVLTFLLLLAIALKGSPDSLNLQSMGYVAGLIALRGFVLNDAEMFPSVLDVIFILIFALVLIIFLARPLKKRHSAHVWPRTPRL